jgi:hypothetical protein
MYLTVKSGRRSRNMPHHIGMSQYDALEILETKKLNNVSKDLEASHCKRDRAAIEYLRNIGHTQAASVLEKWDTENGGFWYA